MELLSRSFNCGSWAAFATVVDPMIIRQVMAEIDNFIIV